MGAAATNYTVTSTGSGAAAPFGARGLEPHDSYLVAGNQITVSMAVWEPGDWIRVVTMPEPATLGLMLLGGLALLRRKRST